MAPVDSGGVRCPSTNFETGSPQAHHNRVMGSAPWQSYGQGGSKGARWEQWNRGRVLNTVFGLWVLSPVAPGYLPEVGLRVSVPVSGGR